MQQTMERGSQVRFPVDNATYDLLQSLTSKLEALSAYGKYLEDADEQSRGLFQQLIDEDTRHAEQLFEALRQQLSQR